MKNCSYLTFRKGKTMIESEKMRESDALSFNYLPFCPKEYVCPTRQRIAFDRL
jgi:hypothetical protein